MNTEQKFGQVELTVNNIGGIDNTTVTFRPGVTVLEGRNATNRTSLLQGLMAALGSEDASLKGDADEGSATLTINGKTHSKKIARKNGEIITNGDPYLDEPKIADLFAFLLESNKARRAVARGDDLRGIIMDPVDTDAIKDRIRTLEREKEELDDELDSLNELKSDLPALETDRTQLKKEIERVRDELGEKESELEKLDVNPEETLEDRSQLEEKLEDLGSVRSQLEDVRFKIETQEDSLDALRSELHEVRSEYQDLPDSPTGDTDIDNQITNLRERKQQLDGETTRLQNAIRLNEELFDDTGESLPASWHESAEQSEELADQLLEANETVTCWTCGSRVKQSEIEATLDQLKSFRRNKIQEVSSVEDQIDELVNLKSKREKKQSRLEALEKRIGEIEDEIEQREKTVAELRGQRDRLKTKVSEFEEEVETFEAREYSEVLNLHKDANQLEFELGKLESELESTQEEIESIEARVQEQEQIEEQRNAVQAKLEELRTRIDRIEDEAVEAFNKHMEQVLNILEYANIERIWIERTEKTIRDGRRNITKRNFDLHVVRQSSPGIVYEDSVDHLSESEREVTGLVFAIAGYLVHEVYQTVPFMLLDSLEAIDSERIAALVDYFREYVPYITVTLLPEDAQALDDDYEYITEI